MICIGNICSFLLESAMLLLMLKVRLVLALVRLLWDIFNFYLCFTIGVSSNTCVYCYKIKDDYWVAALGVSRFIFCSSDVADLVDWGWSAYDNIYVCLVSRFSFLISLISLFYISKCDAALKELPSSFIDLASNFKLLAPIGIIDIEENYVTKFLDKGWKSIFPNLYCKAGFIIF